MPLMFGFIKKIVLENAYQGVVCFLKVRLAGQFFIFGKNHK